ncbi:MAG TPA: hypothetical protein VFS21_13370 [Roseiflexaceae bacterium]|nr:hypothetical protein [Roseiflexaceae bacterium]
MERNNAQRRSVERLLRATRTPNTILCEQVRPQIAALVAAEQAGVDVDSLAEFQALLAHLDHCAVCVNIYVRQSEGHLDQAAPLEP